MEACNIDPTRVPDVSLVSQVNLTDSWLLPKLRDEFCEQHPPARKTRSRSRKRPSVMPRAEPYAENPFEQYARDLEQRASEAENPFEQYARDLEQRAAGML
jgi:hypothetical protein